LGEVLLDGGDDERQGGVDEGRESGLIKVGSAWSERSGRRGKRALDE